MLKKASVTLALLMLAGCARTPKSVVDDVGKAIGAGNLKSIQYSGSGYIYAIGQSFQPNDRYSKFNLKATPAWWTTTKARCGKRMSGRNSKIRRAVEECSP